MGALARIDLAKSADSDRDSRRILLSRLAILELATILLVGVSQTFFGRLIEQLAEPPSILLSDAGLVILAASSFLPIYKWNSWSKVGLLVSQFFLVAIASACGVPRLFGALYMLVVARAGLCLSVRAALLMVIAAVLIQLLGKELRFYLTERAIYAMSLSQHVQHVLLFGRLANSGLSYALTALCAIGLAGEMERRIERQRLNKLVEDAAARVERMRMSREIHDSLGHVMTSMCMQLDFATAALSRSRVQAVKAMELVQELSLQLRREFRELRQSPDCMQVDFSSALADLIEQYRRQGGFDLSVQLEENLQIPPAVAHDVFSVIKEGLHNVKKYADAGQVRLSALSDGTVLKIEIADNGRGFDPQAVKSSSYGLKGMSERLSAFSGTVTIDSAPGAGTRLLISVPLEKEQPADVR